uniref:Receptor ligand binding region domain-containing protein n=1 Tax=Mycena chlorophos TaxID=658473 RepID=A0ABQ0LAQ1_MYCCL|nr:predicted protein [Mycena chlorophos]
MPLLLLALLLALVADTLALPTRMLPEHSLEMRTGSKKCPGGNAPPCVCSTGLGLWLSGSLKCGASALTFQNPADPTDATLDLLSHNFGVTHLECDHIVELQFIAKEITAVPGICTHFQSGTQGKDDYKSFLNVINNLPNLLLVDENVNAAKGVLVGGKNLDTGTTQLAALGSVNYLKLLDENAAKNIYPGSHVATTIDGEMTKIMGAGKGFKSGLQGRWDAIVQSGITRQEEQHRLPNSLLLPHHNPQTRTQSQ